MLGTKGLRVEMLEGVLADVRQRLAPDVHVDDLAVYAWPQTWSSTALGFGGMGGQALTVAPTTVVVHENTAFVYFAGRPAYRCAWTLLRETLATRPWHAPARREAAIMDPGCEILEPLTAGA